MGAARKGIRLQRNRKTLCVDLRWIDSSGVGVYIKGIMPGLVGQLEEVSIVGLGNVKRLNEFPWSSAPNVRLINCDAARYSIAEQLALPLVIPKETDLFFAPYYTIPLLYRGPLVVTVHDMSHMVVPEIVNNRRKRVYAKFMYRALSRRASAILTVSEFSKCEFIRLMHSTDQDKIYPTHLGVGPEWYKAKELPSPRQRAYLICVGNVKPYKNLPRLVEAFLSIRHRIPQDLLIVGQSEGLITGESATFFERVSAAGDRVQMTGFVSDEELMALVAHADALVMPSLYEGFGLPALEAMAAGTPVAVSRTASLPEVCGDAAQYFDPLDVDDMAQKIAELATEPPLRSKLAVAGLARSREFNWAECSAVTARVLLSALG